MLSTKCVSGDSLRRQGIDRERQRGFDILDLLVVLP